MPERSPRRRRAPTSSYALPPRRPLRKAPAAKPVRALPRCSSDPILWTVRLAPEDGGRRRQGGCASGGSSGIGDALLLPRPHTWTDGLSPCGPHHSMEDGRKVVVSVTVEGSPGPVRAMVRLSATVDEAIGAVVKEYGKEGRSPKLDRKAVNSFELHYSHFSLQSLNKSDKIGEVGGRSFYLRKSCSTNGTDIGSETCDATAGGGGNAVLSGGSPSIIHPHLFLSFIASKLKKFVRRTRKLWKMVLCIACG